MIVQLLCPERHCLLASVYEEGVGNFKEASDALSAMLQPKGVFNNWCGICGSRELHFEEGRTKFKTLVEAAPFIASQALANAESRQALDKAGLTYDTRRNN